MTDGPESTPPEARLIGVEFDTKSIGRARPDVEHERSVAVFDLLEENRFQLVAGPAGPYRLYLAIVDDRLAFEIRDDGRSPLTTIILALGSFRRLIRDYVLVCDSYYDAIRTAPPSRIEAIDMGRRALHNEASQLLVDRLAGRIDIDPPTARRLFTLICALHWKG